MKVIFTPVATAALLFVRVRENAATSVVAVPAVMVTPAPAAPEKRYLFVPATCMIA